MRQRHLQPGMYLVGRDDKAVEPFFVLMENSQMSCHPDLAPLMDHAYVHDGWWWEPMLIPSFLDEANLENQRPSVNRQQDD